ncbi:MAG: WG repeat-containing protein [Prevotella sp.]|nr:WG repeat-containing protein [Prevotella sp.]MCM1074839.1 WG repeat-containing protein [Ruminococcus sp.]
MKRQLLILLAVMLCAVASWAAKTNLTPHQDPKTNLWGYVDEQGKWKIKPTYTEAGPFVELKANGKQYAWVDGADHYSILIDAKGKQMIPDKFLYVNYLTPINDNLIFTSMRNDNTGWKYIFITTKGITLVPFVAISLNHAWADEGKYLYILMQNKTAACRVKICTITGEVSSSPMNFKMISEIDPGCYLIEKDGNYFVYDVVYDNMKPTKKIGNILTADSGTETEIDFHPYKNLLYFDKDLKYIGCYVDCNSLFDLVPRYQEGSEWKLRRLYKRLKKGENKIYPFVNLETGEVVGHFKTVNRYAESQYYEVQDSTGYWGFVDPNGKKILPAKYKKLTVIAHNSTPEFILATTDDNNTDLMNLKGEKVRSYPIGKGHLRYTRAGYGEYVISEGSKYYAPDGKEINVRGYSSFEPNYDNNGKHIGWYTWRRRSTSNGDALDYIYYDKQFNITKETTNGPKDVAAEVYKKRDFVGRPLALLERMQDKGYIIGGDMLYGGRLGTIFTIVLKDKSRYRIEMDRNGCIIKATKY